MNASLWLTAWIEAEATAGEYTGEINITPENDKPTTIDVQVRVFDVKVPRPSKLRSLFLIWNMGAKEQLYGKNWDENLKQRFMDQLLRYRLNFSPPLPWDKVFAQNKDGAWTAEWNNFDRQVKNWMAKGVTFFRIGGIVGWRNNLDFAATDSQEHRALRKVWAAKLALLDKHLVEKGWHEIFATYAFDEPPVAPDYPKKGDTTGPENAAKIREFATYFQKHAPNLRLMMVDCDPYYESVSIDKPAFIFL